MHIILFGVTFNNKDWNVWFYVYVSTTKEVSGISFYEL